MKKTHHCRRDLREKKLTTTQFEAIDHDVERQRFLAGVNADFAALRNNPTV